MMAENTESTVPVTDGAAPDAAEGQRRGRGGRGGGGDNRGGGGRGRNNDRRPAQEEDDGTIEKLVHINRVSKTVKGGKRFGFAALVVVGDEQQYVAAILWVGGGWCSLLSLDRFLLRPTHRNLCQYEGFLGESGW